MRFKNGYKAVFFDLDGTLRHTVPLLSDVFAEKARELGLNFSEEKRLESGRWEHYYWASSSELRTDSETYTAPDTFWANYAKLRLEKLGASSAEIEEFATPINAYLKDEYKGKDWAPPELHEILPALRSAGFKLGVLSNRRDTFMDKMRELALDQYFEFIMAAGEVGSWKPNPEAFAPMIKYFDVNPAESLYIGDNYYADVIGARAAGMIPILYDPRGLFPDADCTRIVSFNQLVEIL